jgi:hypothetical protein
MAAPQQLAAMLATRPAAGVRLVRAAVVNWDGSGHVVRLAGADMTGLPILASAGTPSVGDVVAVLQAGQSYLILGKITT